MTGATQLGSRAGAAASAPAGSPGGASTLDLVGRALLLKVALLAVLLLTASYRPSDSPYLGAREGETSDLFWYLSRGFDAPAYQGLAKQGYTDAFSRNYPLGYPLMIRALAPLTGSYQVAAVLASNLCALGALLFFIAIARRYAGGGPGRARGGTVGGRRVTTAVMLFACTPGWLAFGTVAYSEGPFLLVSMAGWWAYLRAFDRTGARPGVAQATAHSGVAYPGAARLGAAGGNRSLAWLLLAGVLAAGSVMVKHLGGPVLILLALVEGWRVLMAGESRARRRALVEAAAVLWVIAPVAWYFRWKFGAHDLAGLQGDIWQMQFAPFGGPASLVALGTAPVYVAQVYITLPLVLALMAKLLRVDARLALLAALILAEALSFTGIAAQSFTRYAWTIWPLALAGLRLDDRALTWALGALLFIVSAWCGLGHVLGTAAF